MARKQKRRYIVTKGDGFEIVDTGIYSLRIEADKSKLPRIGPRQFVTDELARLHREAKEIVYGDKRRTVASDAYELLVEIGQLQMALDPLTPGYKGSDDHIAEVAMRAFEVGGLVDRVIVRQREHLALDGLAQSENRRLIKEQKQQDADARHTTLCQAVDAELARQKRCHEKRSLNRAMKAVVADFGGSVSTIKRALKKRRIATAKIAAPRSRPAASQKECTHGR